jgi:5-methylcytosine-specific restriction protein A
MTTYLLTWNPKRWYWDDLQDNINDIETNGYYDGHWSCGRNKRIQSGDRLFLICLGTEPRGICASGWAISDVDEGEHWDDEQAALGKTSLYIDVRFDTLLDPDREPVLPRGKLNEGIFAQMHWDSQASGVTIPDDVAAQLEIEWARFLGKPSVSPMVALPEEVAEGETYFEGARKQIAVNVYERNAEARARCIRHYGLKCSVCGFDFEQTYGKLGTGFIHVHHLKPLAEVTAEYELNPIRDLRPVCPNCHAMIHKKKPAYTIEELKALLAKQTKR